MFYLLGHILPKQKISLANRLAWVSAIVDSLTMKTVAWENERRKQFLYDGVCFLTQAWVSVYVYTQILTTYFGVGTFGIHTGWLQTYETTKRGGKEAIQGKLLFYIHVCVQSRPNNLGNSIGWGEVAILVWATKEKF